MTTSLVETLRTPVFRRLWLALIVFNLGHLIQVVASSWLILELTGSPLWVSLMVGAPTLPLLLLSLPAGAAADLLDKRKVLMGSSLVLAVAASGMSTLWVAGGITPGRLVGLGLLLGVGVAFFNPAWQAIVPALVPTSLVPGAVSLNSATGGVATALGPAIGGLMVATVGPGWAFGVATIGYLAILVTILFSRPFHIQQDRSGIGVAIATGVRYIRFSTGFLSLLLLGSLFGFTSAALRAMLPNLTSDVLGGGATAYGLLLGSFGAGAIVGGFTRDFGAAKLATRMVPMSISAFGVAGLVTGVAENIVVTGLSVFAAGLLWSWILSTLISIFQLLTPDWVRGRTMGAFVLSVFGILPIGAVLSGQLGNAIGPAGSLTVFSTAVIIIGILATRMPLPVLEHIDPPEVPMHTGPTPKPEGLARAAPVMVTTQWSIDEADMDAFLSLLGDIKRLRLSTGAYDWAVYRSARDLSRVTEVYMIHSWDQHVQQRRRLDTRALEILRRAEGFGSAPRITDRLIAFDIDTPPHPKHWQALHERHIKLDPDEEWS